MSGAPRHAGGSEPLLRGLARSARGVFLNGDAGFLLALAVGALLWPWVGWVAAAAYVAVLALVAVTLLLARRRGRALRLSRYLRPRRSPR